MAVTEVLQGLGSWSLTLKSSTPKRILDALEYFGHVAIHAAPVVPEVDGDGLLASSRYTGVLRKKEAGDATSIGGAGMAFWLGDEDKKGYVYETQKSYTNATFQAVMADLLPPSVHAGTIYNLAKNFSGNFQYVSPREALNYVATTLDAEWRVNGDATLDAGLVSDLYVTDPQLIDSVIVRRNPGVDIGMRGLRGSIKTGRDVEDFTTRTLLLANGEGGGVATGSADIAPGLNPYVDMFGNPVKLTRVISESTTDPANAPARAQLQLNRFTSPRDAITMSTDEFDVKGTIKVGDYSWVYDPDAGVVDGNNEIIFRGDRLNPMKLRVTEMTWPIARGFSVAYRAPNGDWFDLTPYVESESGSTTIVVGGFNRSLTQGGADGGAGGSRPVPNTTVPGVPTWVVPFKQSIYSSPVDGATRAQVEVAWTRPLNTDGSNITDGDHWDIRYRTTTTPIFPVTYNQMAVYTYNELSTGTWRNPIHYEPGAYQYQSVPWSELSFLLPELTPSMPYEIQIRAVDGGTPANAGEWSTVELFQTSGDTLGPFNPAAPEVAASRIALQITHYLGRSDGGDFNLDLDLHHLEIHVGGGPTFDTTDATMIGKLAANSGLIRSQVPAVGTFQIEQTDEVYVRVVAVDNSGNKSTASSAAQATALLIDNAHISDLTVSKITAGTITADWVVGARIKTAHSGARVEMSPDGIQAYNADNTQTVDISASTGDATITGKLQTGTTGQRIIVDPNNGGYARILMYDNTTTNYVSQEVFGGNFQIQARKVSDTSPNGGRLLFNLASDGSGSAYLAFQNASSSWHYQVGSNGGHHLKGFFSKVDSMGGLGALHVDQVGGSGTSMSYSYGPTYVSTPLPFVEIQGTSGSPPTASSHAVTSRSQTGFSIQYPAGNCDVFIWAVRYG